MERLCAHSVCSGHALPFTVRNCTFKERIALEESPLCKGSMEVIFTRPFQILGKVTFYEHVNVDFILRHLCDP